MKATLYDLKAKLATVGDELAKVEAEIIAKASNPAVMMSDIEALEKQKADLQKRFDLLKGAHDREVAEQEARIRNTNKVGAASTDAERLIAAKAEFIRAAIERRPVAEDALAVLRALPSPNITGGDKLLPTTMSNTLLHEPFVTNPLRGSVPLTNIKGLELPKISYTLDDDDFITDEQTAKELELEGDKVVFGRNKFKVIASISDTVMHGSDLDLVTYVDNALASGLAAKEKKTAFAVVPKVGEEHMSYYTAGILEVPGATLYEAITSAIADLHEDYRERAKVVMRFADWVKLLQQLANNSITLYQRQPEEIIGKPVIFSDMAVHPIVGDFSYAHINYDGDLVYDTDKDVKSGDYLFVLTAWFDQQIKLKSAFRIAKVVPAP